MMPSLRKNSKKTKILNEADATTVIEGALITSMLEEHASTFANMEGYAKDLLDLRSINDTNPKAILRAGWTIMLESEQRKEN